jgi:hypothetical protein
MKFEFINKGLKNMTTTKKIFSLLLTFAFVIAVNAFTAPQADAAVIFPAGCTSAIGYSVTTGLPCNGTASASMMIAGCPTVLGYSVTTGVPCSGSTEAIFYLAGCTSIYGVSAISGQACNGTNIVTVLDPVIPAPSVTPVIPVFPAVPGLPTTGSGGMASLYTLGFVSAAILATIGIGYGFRRSRVSR